MQNETPSATWSARFQAQLESGLTVLVWCKQNGISKTIFYAWHKRLHQAPATTPPKVDRTAITADHHDEIRINAGSGDTTWVCDSSG